MLDIKGRASMTRIIALVASCAIWTGCGDDSGDGGTDGGTITDASNNGGDTGTGNDSGNGNASCDDPDFYTNYVMQWCVGCHSTALSSAGLNLEANGLAGRVVNQPAQGFDGCEPTGKILVDPNNIDNSYILEKLRANPACGDRMPPSPFTPVTDAQYACFRAWLGSL